MKENNIIIIGKILKPHGLKGFVKLQSFAENPKDIFKYKVFLNKDENQICNLKFKNNLKSDVFVTEINGVSDRNEADKLKGVELFMKRNELPELNNDEFYYNDLIGLKVLTDNKKAGNITMVNNFGAGTMIEIKWDNKEIETIPFTDAFIEEINLKENYIKVNLPVYLTTK